MAVNIKAGRFLYIRIMFFLNSASLRAKWSAILFRFISIFDGFNEFVFCKLLLLMTLTSFKTVSPFEFFRDTVSQELLDLSYMLRSDSLLLHSLRNTSSKFWSLSLRISASGLPSSRSLPCLMKATMLADRASSM